MNISIQQKSFKSAKQEIEAYGFSQPFAVRIRPYFYMGVAAIIAVSLIILSRYDQAMKLAPMLISLGAYVVAFQQWRAARNENSMDKYYERLDKADQRLAGWQHAREMLSHFWEGEKDQAAYERINYFYIELDNLEYVIEKYKLGYVSPEQARRGLRTFRSRCLSAEFRQLATKYINTLEGTGYQKTTVDVVGRVLEELELVSGTAPDYNERVS